MRGLLTLLTILTVFFDGLLWNYGGPNLFLESALFFIVPMWTLYLIGSVVLAPWVMLDMDKKQYETYMALTAMTNRDLEDIGITRGDIKAVALGTFEKE